MHFTPPRDLNLARITVRHSLGHYTHFLGPCQPFPATFASICTDCVAPRHESLALHILLQTQNTICHRARGDGLFGLCCVVVLADTSKSPFLHIFSPFVFSPGGSLSPRCLNFVSSPLLVRVLTVWSWQCLYHFYPSTQMFGIMHFRISCD